MIWSSLNSSQAQFWLSSTNWSATFALALADSVVIILNGLETSMPVCLVPYFFVHISLALKDESYALIQSSKGKFEIEIEIFRFE
jgi:hypothetical protein